MKILDTNLWVFGTLGTHERAVALLEAIDRGETTAALNAYIVQEILDAFATPGLLTAAERDRVQTAFLERVPGMIGLIEAPSHRDIAADILQDRRQMTEIHLVAQILDIQPKDVPILVLAYRHAEREPTILTNDESFAACVPAEHNLPTIAITHVP
jgi:predicted nucleic acid-binding protein